ncbi:MAG: cytochrome c [Arenibacterium sp.]
MSQLLSQRVILVASFCTFLMASIALSYDAPRHPLVYQRMLAMSDARQTLERLNDMANGRAIFHPDRARLDRRRLIRFARSIRKLFRREVMDSHSRAKPKIWESKTEFRVRARFTLISARALNPRSPEKLRDTLPGLLQTCLDCHTRFRVEE